MSETPDVYLFVVDSLRADAVSYDPDHGGDTPNLATFARECVVFEDAVTHGVGTAPAMTALLTGELPLSHGGHWWLDDERTPIAELLSDAGYRTAAIHTNPNVSRLRNFDRGFDVFDENLLPVWTDRIVETAPEGVVTALNKVARILGRTPYLSARRLREKITDWVGSVEGPRFVWTQFMDVHGPYLDHDRSAYLDKYRSERLWRKAAVNAPDAVTDEEHRELRERYRSEVRYWDGQLGELFEELRRTGAFSDALVIVTSDHGDEFREHGQYGHGNNPYEELVSVPLVVKFPDERMAGERIKKQVRLLDIVPTILDVVGIQAPESLDGKSLCNLLGDKEPLTAHEPAVIEKEVRGTDDLRFAVRTNRWKYIEDRHEDKIELYDLDIDPTEGNNISTEHPTVVEEFRLIVTDRIEDISDRHDRKTASAGVEERLERLGYVE